MSIKCSIAHGGDFHLYYELFDHKVYLRLEGPTVCFECAPGVITAALPMHVLKILKDIDLSQLQKDLEVWEPITDDDQLAK